MIHGPYQTRRIFPQWDSNIPRLGLKCSHVGTKFRIIMLYACNLQAESTNLCKKTSEPAEFSDIYRNFAGDYNIYKVHK